MQYRKFGSCDFQVSVLGFGCMRLPLRDDNPANIDEEEAIRQIRYAVDEGVNYIDTAYPYHRGNSEIVVGKALKDGYRQKVKLATKLPVWEVKSYSDFDRLLNEQLKKLETDYIDVYLLHSLNKDNWKKMKDMGVLRFLEQAVADGRIKHPAFSFHDKVEVFKEIVDAYNWDACQIQFNYMDEHYQAGVEGLKYAASKGIAVVIMEPLRGGKLARNIPAEVQRVFDESGIKRSPAAWALRWIWNFSEVSVVLSGMGKMEEVKENIQTAAEALPLSLTQEELATIRKVKEIYEQKVKVNCTECGYCQPCPNNVSIPQVFRLYNDLAVYGVKDEVTRAYKGLMKNGQDAAACVECGQCEEACPQNLSIIEHLKEAHEALSA